MNKYSHKIEDAYLIADSLCTADICQMTPTEIAAAIRHRDIIQHAITNSRSVMGRVFSRDVELLEGMCQ